MNTLLRYIYFFQDENDYYAMGYSDEASTEEENLRKAIEASMRDK